MFKVRFFKKYIKNIGCKQVRCSEGSIIVAMAKVGHVQVSSIGCILVLALSFLLLTSHRLQKTVLQFTVFRGK